MGVAKKAVGEKREWAFVEAYLAGYPAAESARRAGYANSTAHNGYLLLRRPSVAKKMGAALAGNTNIPRVLNALQGMAFADIGDFVRVEDGTMEVKNLDALTPAQRAQIQQIKRTKYGLEVKLYNRQWALGKLIYLLYDEKKKEEKDDDWGEWGTYRRAG